MKRLPQILMLSAALLLIGVFFFPLWNITLYAPQYPEGINMYIWVNQITGDTPFTLQNVNILNHYIGMQYIEPESIPELQYFPYIVGAMIGLGVLAAIVKKPAAFWTWTILLMVLGALGIYDFYLWEYDYGHNLDPNAPIKIPGMVYQPPLIGSKMLLNFDAHSWPHWGSLFLFLSTIVGLAAAFLQSRVSKKAKKGQKGRYAFAGLALLLLLSACAAEPQPIYYGEENCASCQMTIVDQRYGAEILTQKGKVYKFDAIECMLHFSEEGKVPEGEIKSYLVTGIDQPGILIDANTAILVQSPALPSPMGMNLSAFTSKEAVEEVEAKETEVYSWETLKAAFPALSGKRVSNHGH